MKINNKCNKLYACPHKCSKCKLCEHHKMKTNYTVIGGGGGIKKCNKCHKYCCYVCTDCEICDIHRKKYCCYLRKTIIDYPLEKLIEWSNSHLILIAHYKEGDYPGHHNMFKYDFNSPQFISGNDENIIYGLENLLRPSVEFKQIQCVLELSRFVYKEKNIDLYIDWIHIQIDFNDDDIENFNAVSQKLQNYGIQMVKNETQDEEKNKYRYVANLDFSNSIYHHITDSLVLSHQGEQPIISPSDIYCFKTSNIINGNTISEKYNNFMTTTTNLETIDKLENYKGIIDDKKFTANHFSASNHKNTAILIATFHIKDILTLNYSPTE